MLRDKNNSETTKKPETKNQVILSITNYNPQ
jgi:hypothetical protein